MKVRWWVGEAGRELGAEGRLSRAEQQGASLRWRWRVSGKTLSIAVEEPCKAGGQLLNGASRMAHEEFWSTRRHTVRTANYTLRAKNTLESRPDHLITTTGDGMIWRRLEGEPV